MMSFLDHYYNNTFEANRDGDVKHTLSDRINAKLWNSIDDIPSSLVEAKRPVFVNRGGDVKHSLSDRVNANLSTYGGELKILPTPFTNSMNSTNDSNTAAGNYQSVSNQNVQSSNWRAQRSNRTYNVRPARVVGKIVVQSGIDEQKRIANLNQKENPIVAEEVKPIVAIVAEEVKPIVATVAEEVKPIVAIVAEEVKPIVAEKDKKFKIDVIQDGKHIVKFIDNIVAAVAEELKSTVDIVVEEVKSTVAIVVEEVKPIVAEKDKKFKTVIKQTKIDVIQDGKHVLKYIEDKEEIEDDSSEMDEEESAAFNRMFADKLLQSPSIFENYIEKKAVPIIKRPQSVWFAPCRDEYNKTMTIIEKLSIENRPKVIENIKKTPCEWFSSCTNPKCDYMHHQNYRLAEAIKWKELNEARGLIQGRPINSTNDIDCNVSTCTGIKCKDHHEKQLKRGVPIYAIDQRKCNNKKCEGFYYNKAGQRKICEYLHPLQMQPGLRDLRPLSCQDCKAGSKCKITFGGGKVCVYKHPLQLPNRNCGCFYGSCHQNKRNNELIERLKNRPLYSERCTPCDFEEKNLPGTKRYHKICTKDDCLYNHPNKIDDDGNLIGQLCYHDFNPTQKTPCKEHRKEQLKKLRKEKKEDGILKKIPEKNSVFTGARISDKKAAKSANKAKTQKETDELLRQRIADAEKKNALNAVLTQQICNNFSVKEQPKQEDVKDDDEEEDDDFFEDDFNVCKQVLRVVKPKLTNIKPTPPIQNKVVRSNRLSFRTESDDEEDEKEEREEKERKEKEEKEKEKEASIKFADAPIKKDKPLTERQLKHAEFEKRNSQNTGKRTAKKNKKTHTSSSKIDFSLI